MTIAGGQGGWYVWTTFEYLECDIGKNIILMITHDGLDVTIEIECDNKI